MFRNFRATANPICFSFFSPLQYIQHGHCGNSPLACGAGCDASASFNGVCERYTVAAAGGKPKPVPSLPKGSFKVVGDTGVAAQHIALVSPTKMLILDKAENNPAKLPDGTAAYNVEYDLTTNQYRVLEVQTNTFCSGGGFLPNGTLISGGGAEARVRLLLRPSNQLIGFQERDLSILICLFLSYLVHS